LVVEVFQESEL